MPRRTPNETQAPAQIPVANTIVTVAAANAATRCSDNSDEVFEDLQGENEEEKKKRQIRNMIAKKVKEHVFRLTKFVRFKGAQQKAAEQVFWKCEFDYLNGKSDDEQKELMKLWVDKYGGMVTSAINTRRSEVQQALRKVFRARYSGKSLPTAAELESILRRDFAPDNDHMYDLFAWWWDSVIPKVAGQDWASDKRHFGYMSAHHFVNKPGKLFVPVATEALAVWIVENNRDCWPKIWAKQDACTETGPGGVPLRCQKSMKHEDGTPYTGDQHAVSCLLFGTDFDDIWH